MALTADQREKREALAKTLLQDGQTNQHITDQTKEQFGTPIAASQLAKIRKDLGIAVKPGRRPKEIAPADVEKAAAPKPRRKAVVKAAAKAVKEAAKPNGKPNGASNGAEDVDGLLRRLMPAMKQEGISVLTLEARGKCIRESTIARGH